MLYPNRFSLSILALSIAAGAQAAAQTTQATQTSRQLEEVLVTADFEDVDAFSSANSLSVVDASAIARRDARHLEQVLATAPNVNVAAGASRGRFLQIRGVGERSQFKDPLDASVGMIIDGIDYSGIGLAGMLFDVEQVDILRGPQGTQFGASAMAGLVNIKSAEPTADFAGKVMAGIGNYDTYSSGLMLNGALNDQLVGRIAISTNKSDGFIDNDFLHRDNTNNLDEQSVNARLKWTLSDDLSIGFVAHYLNADNGYNAFSLDNSRDIPADDPGFDRQRSRAFAVNSDWTGSEAFELQTNITAENSEMGYAYDWDWSNLAAAYWRGSEDNERNRDSYSADIRFLSKPGHEILGGASWIGGVYGYQRQEDFYYTDDYDGFSYLGPFSSDFEQQREAAYGQLTWPISPNLELSTGLRVEHYKNDYSDSADLHTEQSETLWGGKISLSYSGFQQPGFENTLVYTSISRGYKAGGINGEAVYTAFGDAESIAFLQSRQTFDAETLINYEIGAKGRYLDNTLALAASLFYMDRQDMQAKSYVLIPPAKWIGYLDNVNQGHNAGLELQVEWLATDSVTLFGSAGYLDTELGDLEVQDIDTDTLVNKSGRDQAHAPHYQFNVGTRIDLCEHLNLSVEADGKDSFYFSNSHDSRSKSYTLLHASLAYAYQDLEIRLWGRNLTDKDYQTRGFYFDNTGYGNQTYYQLGDPRTYGVTATYNF